ncbi:hypothetical protein [Cesiribacter sp. SM1]|uniref:hypothetical protein n=1 Tax=Cesiribacter sp. SM1 TaxID=2861196 RepID=UPI001CD2CFF0|nr:hypothetical protein [Cesiribacter sp. SM1]
MNATPPNQQPWWPIRFRLCIPSTPQKRNELISLDIEDLHFDERGILVEVKRSKTDQMGQGLVKAIFYGADPALCPVLTLKRWISTLSHKHGPLFVRVRKGDQLTSDRLTDQIDNLARKEQSGTATVYDSNGQDQASLAF